MIEKIKRKGTTKKKSQDRELIRYIQGEKEEVEDKGSKRKSTENKGRVYSFSLLKRATCQKYRVPDVEIDVMLSFIIYI